MVAAGKNADFNMPIARCGNCGGLLGKEIELLGMKRRVPVTCPCRAEVKRLADERMQARDVQRRLDRFRAYSLMDAYFAASTFEAWKLRDDNRDLYDLGREYCDKWGTMLANNRGLLVHGKAGNGKTFFSFAVANELYSRSVSVIAVSVARILDTIRQSYSANGELGEMEVLNAVRDSSLLILDDLGVEQKTYWSYQKLYEIIDARYRAKKPTIITTNLLIDDEAGVNELRDNLAIIDAKSGHRDKSHRIYNRLVEMCAFISVEGESWRISKGEKNEYALHKELGLERSKP